MMDVINSFAWVGANLLIAYIAVVVILFVLMYYVFFDPKATTAGSMIFRFMLSLFGVVSLVFVGIFVDPSVGRSWLAFPGDTTFWRPLLRFGIYAYMSYTITTLAVSLVMRKWFPHKVKKKSDLALVKPRHDTRDIPIIEQ